MDWGVRRREHFPVSNLIHDNTKSGSLAAEAAEIPNQSETDPVCSPSYIRKKQKWKAQCAGSLFVVNYQ
jgi:hypothetical protein